MHAPPLSVSAAWQNLFLYGLALLSFEHQPKRRLSFTFFFSKHKKKRKDFGVRLTNKILAPGLVSTCPLCPTSKGAESETRCVLSLSHSLKLFTALVDG